MAQQGKMVTWGFAAVSVLCIVVAVLPLFKGGSLNVTYLGAGVVFLIVAIAARRKNQPGG